MFSIQRNLASGSATISFGLPFDPRSPSWSECITVTTGTFRKLVQIRADSSLIPSLIIRYVHQDRPLRSRSLAPRRASAHAHIHTYPRARTFIRIYNSHLFALIWYKLRSLVGTFAKAYVYRHVCTRNTFRATRLHASVYIRVNNKRIARSFTYNLGFRKNPAKIGLGASRGCWMILEIRLMWYDASHHVPIVFSC